METMRVGTRPSSVLRNMQSFSLNADTATIDGGADAMQPYSANQDA